MKKQISLVLAAAAVCSTLSVGAAAPAIAGDKVSFTIFNSKSELEEYLEDAAEEYGEENDVDIEVYYSQDTVSSHLATRYASKNPYTLNMVDAKDIYSIGAQYGLDLSDQDWVKDTDYAISTDGKVIGFPFCIEARGLLYNAGTISKITGEEFDPDSIKTLDDYEAFLKKLVDGGMESPTGILKPDWSLAAHFLQQVYEEREDPEAFVQDLYAGKVDLMKDEKFNALMDFFDVQMKYNMFKDAAISVEDAQVHQALAEGEDAFQFGGCWEWNDLIDFDYSGPIGIMPVPQNLKDAYTGCIVGGGSKYFYIDNSENTTPEQQQAAEKFLDWLVYSEDGQTLISDTCAVVSPFRNNDVTCANDIGAEVKKYADAGKMVPNYDHDPDDHYPIVGASMQKYLAGQIDRKELAKEIEDYWKNVKPAE